MPKQTSSFKSPAQAASLLTPCVPPSLPQGIDVFGAGTQIDSSGKSWSFDQAMLDDIVGSYDPALHEAPLTIGHPADNLPAYGWVTDLSATGGHLYMNHQQVRPEFAEMVESGAFKKRSASIYPPEHPSNPKPGHWYLRHVAFLGAEPPAIKGLKDIQFNDNSDGCINLTEELAQLQPNHPRNFSEKGNVMPDTTPTAAAAVVAPASTGDQTKIDELQKKVTGLEEQITTVTAERDALKTENESFKAQLEAIARTEADKLSQENIDFAEKLFKEGRLKVQDKTIVIETLKDLDKATLLEFKEGNNTRTVSKKEAYKKMLEGKAPVVNFGEFAGGPAVDAVGTSMSDEEFHTRAKAYSLEHNVSFVEACAKIKQQMGSN